MGSGIGRLDVNKANMTAECYGFWGPWLPEPLHDMYLQSRWRPRYRFCTSDCFYKVLTSLPKYYLSLFTEAFKSDNDDCLSINKNLRVSRYRMHYEVFDKNVTVVHENCTRSRTVWTSKTRPKSSRDSSVREAKTRCVKALKAREARGQAKQMRPRSYRRSPGPRHSTLKARFFTLKYQPVPTIDDGPASPPC